MMFTPFKAEAELIESGLPNRLRDHQGCVPVAGGRHVEGSPLDLQVRVLAAVAAEIKYRAAGERFGVSAASVNRRRTRERRKIDCEIPTSVGTGINGRPLASSNETASRLNSEKTAASPSPFNTSTPCQA